jgi:hypothetical protein
MGAAHNFTMDYITSSMSQGGKGAIQLKRAYLDAVYKLGDHPSLDRVDLDAVLNLGVGELGSLVVLPEHAQRADPAVERYVRKHRR